MGRFFVPLTSLLIVCVVGAEPASTGHLVAKPELVRTLINPNCSHCQIEAKRRAKDLRDDDRVLCWIRGYSDGGAIPIRFFLNPYRVISDTYGVFVYDPDAGFARGFAPSVDFEFFGWRNGVMVMQHKDGTLYSCLSGVAFDGPKKGTRLQPIPNLVSDWGFWLQRYPNNVAYEMHPRYRPVHLPDSISSYALESRGPGDDRLPGDAPVLGVSAGEHARAYPLALLERERIVRDTLEGTPMVALWYAPTHTAAAYRSVASPPEQKGATNNGKQRSVTLALDESVPQTPFVDKETGSHWDIAGRAVDGQLKGYTLGWLDGTQVKWFAWSAEYPRSTVYGR
jgi:hypothetical protein